MYASPITFWKDPLEKEMATHSVILAQKTQGQRSLAGYSPWDCKESDTTERLTHTHITSPFGSHKFKFVFIFYVCESVSLS